ncbi:MAG: LysR family transcriptional regulator [Gammaproteobacteria bacterium]|nr:LysR family transcriptional regulator [Gammaproteobacteria bacterium]
MLDDIALFVTIVKAGSLKAAAKVANLPPATVSRRLKILEQQLSCRLIHRNSHQFTVTNEGAELYQQSVYLVESIGARLASFRSEISGISGNIKVLAPLSLTASTLQPIFTSFLNQNVDIDLQLQLSNELTNFLASGADFAIRVGSQENSELSQVKLGELQTLLVASPCYAAKVSEQLTSPEHLASCKLIVSSPVTHWKLQCTNSGNQVEVVQSSVKITANELGISKSFALDGLGIALLPITEIQEELKNGTLVNVLPTWEGYKREIFAIWYRRQLLTNRASQLIDHIKSKCKELPHLG